MNQNFKQVGIIGLGLLGSSLCHAINQKLEDVKIIGFDQKPEVRVRAGELNLCDVIVDDLSEIANESDLVILAVPVGVSGVVTEAFINQLPSGAIISDVGSVKSKVIEQISPVIEKSGRTDLHFIPAHPIAGTEESGPDAGFATLFENRWTVITPIEGNDESKIADLKLFWEGLGANVETMDAAHHDRVLAITSHIPHLIAYNIVGTAADVEEVTQSEVIKYSAGGFRDFTRLAASNPTMWRDVFLNNKESVLEMLGRFNEDLIALQRAIRWEDGDALYKFFDRTRDIRSALIDAGQESAKPNFGRDKIDNGTENG